jgi:hypothetical protein
VPDDAVPDDDDEQTVIVHRISREHTRIVARRASADRPDGAAAAPEITGEVTGEITGESTDDATARSSRGSTVNDTLLSARRAAATEHIPAAADPLQGRYEPPQVQSGASVRYAARPAPAIISPRKPTNVPDVHADPARIRLADAAAEIRERAAATARSRRRFTLIAVIASTVLAVIAVAASAGFTVPTW